MCKTAYQARKPALAPAEAVMPNEVLQGDKAAAWQLIWSRVRSVQWVCEASSSNYLVLVQQATRHAVPCIMWLFIAAAAGAFAAPLYPNSSCHNDAQVRQRQGHP